MRSIGRSRFLLIGLTAVVMCSLVAGLLSRARVSYAASYCQVSYIITSQWPGGFGANIVIQNTGGSAWNGWALTFAFPAARQSVAQGWNGTFSQSRATWFSGVGSPYGGCGVPDGYIDSSYYLALNVQNTPGDSSTYLSRPISVQNASKIGVFDNSLNCGRWVRVTIGAYCTGINDGAPNQLLLAVGSALFQPLLLQAPVEKRAFLVSPALPP